MKKKFLSLLLSFVMVMSLALPVHAAEEWNADCFTIDGTTITGLSEDGVALLETNTEMVLPEKNPAGEAITEIGVSAFDAGNMPGEYTAANKITAVTIPGTVTTIGNFAFRNTSLKEVVLPDSVTTLGSAVFLDSDDGTIEKITLSKNLTTIPASTFMVNKANGPLKELVIPEGVTKIESRAFSGNNITSLSLPTTLEEIGSNAFVLHQLTDLVIPENVTEIGGTAFSQYQEGAPSTLESVTFGSKLTEIGSNAFRACALTEVDIPASLINLNKNAFQGGTKGTVTVYAANADQASQSGNYIKVITAGTGHSVVFANTWDSDCFTYDGTTITGLSSKGEKVLNNNTEMVLPATNPEGVAITAIGVSAFDAGTMPGSYTVANKITAVTIPSTVTEIGNFAFRNCSLKEVVLPDSVTTLGSAVFLDSDDGTIEKITLSKNLTTIPASAFMVNKGNGPLKELVIPEGVTKIDSRAFSGNNITSLSLPSTLTEIGSNAFVLHQLTELVIPENVTEIGGTAFSQYQTGAPSTLESVTFGSKLEEIGSNAFRACALTEVDIPASLINLNKSAFANGTKGTVTVYAANADQANQSGDYVKVIKEGTGHKVVYVMEGSVDLKKDQIVYDGDNTKPVISSVKDSAGNVIPEGNYEVIYEADSTSVGKHTALITITSDGKYAGEMAVEYVVVPAEVEGLKGFRYQVGNRVKLEWKESTGASGYKVQYKSAKSSKTYTKYVTTLSDVKNNLSCSKTYTFKVTPYFEDENGVKYMASSEMDSVKVTTAKAISKTVGQVYETSVEASSSSSSKVKVSWNNVSNEKGYQISRSSKADGTYIVKTVKSTSAKSTTVSGGTKGTTYYYKVRAYRTVGTKKVYSDWSEPIAFTLE